MNYENLDTPVYICEEKLLEKNLKLLDYVQKQSGAKIILALKGFAMHSTFPLVKKYLKGCTASGLHEAKLAHEYFKGEVHTYSPAFKDTDIEEIAKISDYIVFNSSSQLIKYKDIVKNINPTISISLRINPEVSFSPKEIYNPCGLYSRLGVTIENFDESAMQYIDGLNFHALCEQNVDALEEVLFKFEANFSKYFKNLKYINFGGGHHITKQGYDVDKLIQIIKIFRDKYSVEVYLELGEAVAWESGILVSSVLDIVDNGRKIAILDTSAEAHMPDTLSMPYRADVRDAGKANIKAHTYRLAGNTCLAGDIIGDYSFDKPLKVGDKIIFEDMAIYTMVKNTAFNGIKLPDIVIKRKNGDIFKAREFHFEDFKNRLS